MSLQDKRSFKMVGRGNVCSLNLQTLIAVMAVILRLYTSTGAVDTAREYKREAMFYSIEDASLIGNVTRVFLATDELDCGFSCLRSDRPHRCFSFNFGRKEERGLHTCELSNSERALEPHRMQSKRGFGYFGILSVYLTRYFPCLSSPCRNGGSCVNGPALEMFFCSCPLEIKVLPYIDNKCNVNNSLILEYDRVNGTFHAEVDAHKYKLNYYEAERLCEILGATLASLDQLRAALRAGMQLCKKGWLTGALMAYPMQRVREHCGNKTGIIGGDSVYDKNNTKWNAWCYKN